MKATYIAIAAAAAVLSACSATPPQPATPKIVTNDYKLRPGTGTVQNVMQVPHHANAATAAAGASQPMQRLEIRMQSGGVQYVDVATRGEINKGDRVEISADGVIRRV